MNGRDFGCNILSLGSNFFKIFLYGNNFWGVYIFEGGISMFIERRKGCEIKLFVWISFLYKN